MSRASILAAHFASSSACKPSDLLNLRKLSGALRRAEAAAMLAVQAERDVHAVLISCDAQVGQVSAALGEAVASRPFAADVESLAESMLHWRAKRDDRKREWEDAIVRVGQCQADVDMARIELESFIAESLLAPATERDNDKRERRRLAREARDAAATVTRDADKRERRRAVRAVEGGVGS